MPEPDVLLYEKEAWASGSLRTAGVDEAGRGPLAGPVVAAALVFEPDFIRSKLDSLFSRLTDSKAMCETARTEYFELLTQTPQVRIGVGIVEAEEIDRINILQATHKAMADAVAQVETDFALVDGLPVKGLPCGSKSIVKGDALSISISAASIIAKVTRDRIMDSLDRELPQYGFAQHKGYGTARHLEALRCFGASYCHRKSFRPVAELSQLNLGL